jgi:hypothetical protein
MGKFSGLGMSSKNKTAGKATRALQLKINRRMKKRLKTPPVTPCWRPEGEFKSETWLIKKKLP